LRRIRAPAPAAAASFPIDGPSGNTGSGQGGRRALQSKTGLNAGESMFSRQPRPRQNNPPCSQGRNAPAAEVAEEIRTPQPACAGARIVVLF